MTDAFDWLPGWDQTLLEIRPYRVIGIDLGTTNSTVTDIVWEPGSGQAPVATLIEIPQLTTTGEIVRDLVPSVVALHNDTEYVGVGAHRMRSAPDVPLVRNRSVWSETKNDIGTRRVYAGAPEGYANPREIAGRILHFLNEAAEDASDLPIDKVVITVPASFQLTQRQDTLDAAASAGIDLAGQDLFDEPVAAFLDYLVHSDGEILAEKDRSRVMVVDFGGGTCDVALLEARRQAGGGVALARKGVSRFHRIGGSDIDAALAHDVFLPQLMEQNGIEPFALNFKHKRDHVIPALSALAEQLKKKLSDLANQRIQLGTFDPKDDSLQVSLPSSYEVGTGSADLGTVVLAQPRLTLGQLRTSTRRFLSQNLLAPKGNEYFQATSIFAPIQDCLRRADWTPAHLDYVLLVGGSSLDYAVRDALRTSYPDAEVLTYHDPLDAQRCVGRGAAYQALLLAAFGTSPLVPTIGDAVSVQTNTGPHEIIPAGASLPFPSDPSEADVREEDGVTWKVVRGLALSEGATEGDVDLKIEFVDGERPLHSQACKVLAPVEQGTPLTLLVRIDDNQRLQVQVVVESPAGEQRHTLELDNPFSVTANPNADRDRIMELEEEINKGGLQTARPKFFKMAQLHHGINENERARQLLEQLLPSAQNDSERNRIIFLLGRVCADMNDIDSAIEYYREHLEQTGDTSAAFNLANRLRAGNPEEALEFVDLALGDIPGPGQALRGDVLDRLGRKPEAIAAWTAALEVMNDPKKLDSFELGWLIVAASSLGTEEVLAAARAEQNTRKQEAGNNAGEAVAGALPDRVD